MTGGGAATAGRRTGLTRREFVAVVVASGGAMLTGCSSPAPAPAPPEFGAASTGLGATSTGPDPDETGTATVDAGAAITDAPGTTEIEIGTAQGATEFSYDKAELSVPSGAQVRLKFTNNTNPKDEVGHDWVLVTPGQEAEVVASGKDAGDDKDWLKADDPNILAHTTLIEGGKSSTIRFTAPAAGRYTYLCTFPDHFAGGQKGTLTVA
jgi:azurin